MGSGTPPNRPDARKERRINMTNATTTPTTLAHALDVADATIAAQTAKMAEMEALIASLTAGAAPSPEVEEVEIVFSQAVSAPPAAPTPRATVYEAATLAAAGERTPELVEGARGVLQTVRHSDVGGSLHLIALQAAFDATYRGGLLVGDSITAAWLAENGRTAAGFPNWRSVNSANVALNRLAHAGLVDRLGNGVGRRGIGYVIPETFFQGACHALTWENGAIVGRRLAVVR